ncbi:flavoprotein [Allonocardiopsis opalescens]|uniref:flavoprotein n=1 Tax=Allonocardiopsis opalescens TaxID=1144618 RepID=UPI00318450EA
MCAAGPARQVSSLVEQAQLRGFDVQVIATPAATDFIDIAALEEQTGRRVRSRHRSPGQPRSPKADAAIIAPASANTINKLANGIADNYALDVLTELIGMGVPVVILPFVNTALVNRHPFDRSVNTLRREGVTVLIETEAFRPHEPGTGQGKQDEFPWELALESVTTEKEG